jgi:predicted nuclease of predicted toxin-antitoxin system
LRFLVDECLPYTVVQVLQGRGHDVFDVAKSRLRGSSDSVLAKVAAREGRIVVTKDLGQNWGEDTGTLPGLWLLRVPNSYRADQVARVLESTIERLELEGFERALVVIAPGRVRIRRLR